MAIQMQQMANMANMVSNLVQMGKEHIRMGDGGAFVQATNSLGGRIVNWCKAAFSSEASANKAIINKVLDSIKNTDGLGDKFASIAKSDFAKNLASGRPISGMKVAQVLDKVFHLAIDEQVKIAEFKAHSDSVFANLKADYAENKGALFDAVAAGIERFHCPADVVDDAFIADVEKNLVSSFNWTAIKSDAKVTPKQISDICMEAARLASLYATKDNSTLVATPLCSTSSEEAALPKRVNELKLEAGIKSDIPLASINKLVGQMMHKISDKALTDHTQTTPEIAQAEIDKVIKKFLDGIKVVEDAPNLTELEKTALTNSIINDSEIMSKDMSQVCVKTLHSTSELMGIFNQRDTTPNDLKAGIDKMMTDFNLAVTTLNDDGTRSVNTSIGADQVMTIRNIVMDTYMAVNNMGSLKQTPNLSDKIYQLTESLKDGYKLTASVLEKNPELSLGTEQKVELLAKLNIENERLKKADSLLSHAMTVGGALNQFRYTAAQLKNPGLKVQGQVVTSLLLLANQYTAVGSQSKHRARINTLELGRMSMDQVRELVPVGHGKFGKLRNVRSAMKTLTDGSILTFSAAKKDIANVPNEPLKADSTLEQKMKYFGAQFLKDLWRGGITLNGEYTPATGSDDRAAMTNILDKVIAFFPDIETASLATCGLHQGLGLDPFVALNNDTGIIQNPNTYLMTPVEDIDDGMLLSITNKGNGKYAADVSISKQKSGMDAVIGMNLKTSYDLDVNTAKGTVVSKATKFDYIMS